MKPASPRPLLLSIVMAGLTGEIVFEAIGLGLAPILLGLPMKPALLVVALGKTIGGVDLSMTAAWGLHLLAGIVLFPAGYVLFRKTTGLRSWMVPGILWGLILWFVAQGLLAPLAGRPFMLGFIPYTWGSLAAHAVYTTVVAFVFCHLKTRTATMADAPARS